jgi:membrane-bound serine protease (ClpP class)
MTALIVALVVMGASLLIAEAHVASYGVLGAAGVAALIVAGVLATGGSIVLGLVVMVPALALAVWLGSIIARKTLVLRHRRPRGGADGLIGRLGTVRHGNVIVDGERWRARRSWADGEQALDEGEQVVVEHVDGLTLSVRRAEEWEVL